MADRTGQQLGNYHLERLLAQGGFGDVYLGEHIHLGTQAAIKVLKTQLVQEDIERFRREARTIARLIHPHIVRILEFGVEESTPFLVMDYAPNGTLRERHPKGSIVPLPQVVSYVKQMAQALSYAHDHKLIHRDVKPENMLIGRQGEVLLSDFGIALIAQSSRYQGIHDLAGTIGYMAPEQIQAHPRPASDQYALGIVVYEWLSGDRPFHGSFTEIAAKHATTPPPSLRAKMITIPPDVEQVVMTALAKEPLLRFANILAFAMALEQASQGGLETVVKPEAPLPASAPSAHEKHSDGVPVSSSREGPTPVEDEEADEKPLHKIVLTINIGKPRLMPLLATLICVLLFGGLISPLDLGHFANFINLSSTGTAYVIPSGPYDGGVGGVFESLGVLVIYGFLETIPLFFGATFGSFIGLLVGGLGFLIGTIGNFYLGYISRGLPIGTVSDYFSFNYSYGYLFLMLYMACLGYVTGFAASRTQRRYQTLPNLFLACIFSLIGVVVGISFLLITFDSFVVHASFAWQQLLLFLVPLPGLIVLLILLRTYDAVMQRIQVRRHHKPL
jgi:serine/threonine protein kinase